MRRRAANSGQATTEYILVLFIAITAFLTISRGMQRFGVGRRIVAPIQEGFKAAYQLGHVKAKDYDSPAYHPRGPTDGQGPDGSNNFRLFINPRFQ